MNLVTHFLTGYFIARGLKYKHNQFETFFLGICAIIVDIDSIIPGLAHATWTHTILIGMLIGLITAIVVKLVLHDFTKKIGLTWGRAIFLAFLGIASHLIVDVFTFHEVCETDAHIYFWPIWEQSFHMNCIWPGVSYTLRIVIEVVYTAVLIIALLFRLIKNKENPFEMFWYKNWLKYKIELKEENEGTIN